jgi:hypothetical protein
MRNVELTMTPELHERLKTSAERNHRSLNSEIILRLERTPAEPIEPIRPKPIEEILRDIDEFRKHLRLTGFKPLSDEEIRAAIDEGRP